eukprot:885276-Pyramimonas_sp.AAC.1
MSRPSEQELTRRSSTSHAVHGPRFALTHASYVTPMLPQGQMLRKDATTDCARDEGAGRTGISHERDCGTC